MTAQELAEALEISVRTVYRDVESLGAAGMPVYADRSYQLLDGYRTWYLVVAAGEKVRTYRVGAVLELTVLDETFTRPADFDLADYWQDWTQRYESGVYTGQARVRMTVAALERMPFIFPPAMSRAAREAAGEPDDHGWLETVAPIESVKHGHVGLLKLGAEAEVLEPSELRQRFVDTARAFGALYGPA